jgi:hypothetical protein
MSDSADVKVEESNYFAHPLLFAGAVLALAHSTPDTDSHAGANLSGNDAHHSVVRKLTG